MLEIIASELDVQSRRRGGPITSYENMPRRGITHPRRPSNNATVYRPERTDSLGNPLPDVGTPLQAEATWELRGTTANEILASIRANGWAAKAAIEYAIVSYYTREAAAGVTAHHVTTELYTSIVMPEWNASDRALASQSLRDQVDSFIATARQHETVHQQMNQQFNRLMEERIAKLPPQPTLSALQEAVSEIKQQVAAQFTADGTAYDLYVDGLVDFPVFTEQH